jgi:hypothetical protein
MAGDAAAATDGRRWLRWRKIMSKTNETSKFDHAKLENRVLADSELDAVSGGTWGEFISSLWPRPENNHFYARGRMTDM